LANSYWRHNVGLCAKRIVVVRLCLLCPVVGDMGSYHSCGVDRFSC